MNTIQLNCKKKIIIIKLNKAQTFIFTIKHRTEL